MDPCCPRCPTGTMLTDKTLKGYNVDVCDVCHGALIRRADVDAMLAVAGRRAAKHGTAASYFERLHATAQFRAPAPSMSCPECHYNMFEVTSHGLVIDFCLNCQHLWFDHGELKAALQEAQAEGTLELVPPDVAQSDTVALIGWMLERMAPE